MKDIFVAVIINCILGIIFAIIGALIKVKVEPLGSFSKARIRNTIIGLIIGLFAGFMLVRKLPSFNFASELKGTWYYYDDSTENGNSKIKINKSIINPIQFNKDFQTYTVKINTGSYSDLVILEGNVTDTYQYGYLGVGLDIDANSLNSLKEVVGIKFKAYTDRNNYRVIIATSDINDYDYHQYIFNSHSRLVEVKIPFNKLKQEGWGIPKSFNKNNIKNISFQSVGQNHDIRLYIKDLEYIR